MSEETVYRTEVLTPAEWQLVDDVKATLKILAKIIQHMNQSAVEQDIDPDKVNDEAELKQLAQERLTPDLPDLNAHQQAVLIGQLAPAIFARMAPAD